MEAALVAGLTGVGMESGDRGRRGPELPAAHLLAADPARAGSASTTSSAGTSSSHGRIRVAGTPTPPRPSATAAIPARIPSPMPPTTSRGRWTPAYIRPNATVRRDRDRHDAPAAAVVSDASAAASANATAECPDTYPSPVACSRTCTRGEQVEPVGPRAATCFTTLAPQYAAWLASRADAVSRGRRVTRAVSADDEQRSDEAPELHRHPHDRPQRIRQTVQRAKTRASMLGDVVGRGDHRPTAGEQRGATDRGDGLAGAGAATSDR